MNAGTIVGYITQPNGSPISGAEIWISQANESGSLAQMKPAAKTDSRGYFQMPVECFGSDTAEFVRIGKKLRIRVGGQKDFPANSGEKKSFEDRFQINGYLIETGAQS